MGCEGLTLPAMRLFARSKWLPEGQFLDPIPAIHGWFQRIDGLVNPDHPENPEKRNSAFRKYFVALMLLVFLMQLLFFILLPQSGDDLSGMPYRSEASFLGIPLYAQGRAPLAWIAVGGAPTGFISVGGLAVGVFAVGGLSIGLVSLGGLAAGLFALGGTALGVAAAFGGAAGGYYAFGGLAVGGIAYAGGGVARGYYVASGGQSEKLIGGKQ